MLRIALCTLLVILAGRVDAYPASGGGSTPMSNYLQYTWGGNTVRYWDPNDAKNAYCAQQGSSTSNCGGGYRATSGTSTSCPASLSPSPTAGGFSNYICYQDNPPTANWYGNTRVNTLAATSCPSGYTQSGSNCIAPYTCPNGGTLSGSTCTCGAGFTDTGTACEANSCPTAGTSLGLQNLTMGWALSPTPDGADVVGGTIDFGAVFGGQHCVPEGGGMCNALVDPTQPAGDCWRSQTPTDQGLYRISCDIGMVSAGTTCTAPAGGSPSSSASGGPACPTGNVGEVNGKAVCLGTIPATGVNFGGTPNAGNPRAGSSPTENTNSEREPSGPNGGGPDGRGGPNVTTGPGGTGTGNNRTGGSGNGTGDTPKLELPTDYNREPTQQSILAELKKARKIDETGTPEDQSAEMKTARDNLTSKLTDLTKAVSDAEGGKPTAAGASGVTGLGTYVSSDSCTNFTIAGQVLDVCSHGDVPRTIFGFFWILSAIAYVWWRSNAVLQDGVK